ncbi:hypothetical protein ACOUFG_13475 [Acinetobacter baumannii]|uniref:hypothetical protein n=1 Tax=Acinetobacter baumannii TaxID=470 RepID=UPI00228BA6D9|nr:hypothetical protein [Acinetobacter baumannii]WFT39267.1 hypothetical protein MTT07_19820 [Acinetobacter baumannii]HCW4385955.1 hypothetical protein [Acinetobacter baumannii]HEN9521052.1 hypothetical protein [Acinetobacter baumannii]
MRKVFLLTLKTSDDGSKFITWVKDQPNFYWSSSSLIGIQSMLPTLKKEMDLNSEHVVGFAYRKKDRYSATPAYKRIVMLDCQQNLLNTPIHLFRSGKMIIVDLIGEYSHMV